MERVDEKVGGLAIADSYVARIDARSDRAGTQHGQDVVGEDVDFGNVAGREPFRATPSNAGR